MANGFAPVKLWVGLGFENETLEFEEEFEERLEDDPTLSWEEYMAEWN